MQKIDVCITDDQRIFRKAMALLLRTFDRIGEIYEANNGEVCLEQVKEKKPHVVLLDLDMPVIGGLECAERLLKKFPNVKVIMLTSHDTEKNILHALELGVNSFLSKSIEPNELEKAIYDVVDNDFHHSELLDSVIHKGLKGHLIPDRPGFKLEHPLSDREVEIFKMLCEELSVKEIADRLSIDEKTIYTHKRNIQSKLKVHNTVGLMKAAHELGFFK